SGAGISACHFGWHPATRTSRWKRGEPAGWKPAPHRTRLRHPQQRIARLLVAHPGAGRRAVPLVQGSWLNRQRVRRRRRLPARVVAPYSGDGIVAAADSRAGKQEIRVRETVEIGSVNDAAEPRAHGADG